MPATVPRPMPDIIEAESQLEEGVEQQAEAQPEQVQYAGPENQKYSSGFESISKEDGENETH